MYSKQLDIETIFQAIHKYSKQILLIILICFIFSCLASNFITKQYSAYMTVSPSLHDLKTKDKSTEDFRGDNTTDFDKFIYLLTSNNVARELVKNKKVSQEIKPTWSLSSLILYGKLKSSNPSEAIQKYIEKNIYIVDIKNSSMKQIILKHADSDFAKRLLNNLYKEADNLIKKKETLKNEKEIAFIKEQLKNGELSENRSAFRELLNHQLQIKSMLSVDLPYSADIVEEINVSSHPNSPSIFLIILTMTAMLGSIFSFLMIYMKENK